jgi:hypothetical protein
VTAKEFLFILQAMVPSLSFVDAVSVDEENTTIEVLFKHGDPIFLTVRGKG